MTQHMITKAEWVSSIIKTFQHLREAVDAKGLIPEIDALLVAESKDDA